MDFILDVLGGYGGGVSAIGLAVLGAYFKYETKGIRKLILEGSEDVTHEQAVKKLNKSFKTATRCLGYEIRVMQNDHNLRANIIDLTNAFNSAWLNEWGEMLDTLYGVTYKGRPLELYIHSMSKDWEAKRELILEALINTIHGKSSSIQHLEKDLSRFKHSLEYNALRWIDTGLRHKEPEPKKVVATEHTEVNKEPVIIDLEEDESKL